MKRGFPNIVQRATDGTSICNFMMENSHQECRIGDTLLLNFSILKY